MSEISLSRPFRDGRVWMCHSISILILTRRSSSRAASSGEKHAPFPFPSKEKESRVRSSSQPHMWREEPMLWDERHFIVGMISRFLHPLDGTSVCSRCQNLKSMSLFLRFISEWPSGLFSHGKVRVARFSLSLLLHPQ